jgi:hypothetical protein
MTTMVTVELLPHTRLGDDPARQGTAALLTARTDLGSATLGFTEGPLGTPHEGGFVLDRHMRACLNRQRDKPWWDAADVLFRSVPDPAGRAGARLMMHPGCAVYACRYPDGRIELALRIRNQLFVISGRIEDRAGIAWCAMAASAMHAWIAAGLDPQALHAIVAADGSGVRFSPASRIRR